MSVTRAVIAKLRLRLAVLALAVLAFISAETIITAPSAAAAVSGCTGWSISGYAACVSADMGSKNTSNHTQWVGNVTAYKTDGATSSLTEVWGDGFYQSHSGNDTSYTWAINKWVASGTYICAAFTYPSGRETACISISV